MDRGVAIDLGSVTIAGTRDVEFEADLRDQLSTRLDITVTANGVPQEGLLVRAAQTNESDSLRIVGITDGHGHARIGPVPSGALRLEASDTAESWVWTRPAMLEAAPGRTTFVAIDVPLVEKELTLVDRLGRTAAFASVEIEHSSRAVAESQVSVTNAGGSVAFRLPVGPIRLWCTPGSTEWLDVPWEPGGEMRVEVR
jgi:hypothetical protein